MKIMTKLPFPNVISRPRSSSEQKCEMMSVLSSEDRNRMKYGVVFLIIFAAMAATSKAQQIVPLTTIRSTVVLTDMIGVKTLYGNGVLVSFDTTVWVITARHNLFYGGRRQNNIKVGLLPNHLFPEGNVIKQSDLDSGWELKDNMVIKYFSLDHYLDLGPMIDLAAFRINYPWQMLIRNVVLTAPYPSILCGKDESLSVGDSLFTSGYWASDTDTTALEPVALYGNILGIEEYKIRYSVTGRKSISGSPVYRIVGESDAANQSLIAIHYSSTEEYKSYASLIEKILNLIKEYQSAGK